MLLNQDLYATLGAGKEGNENSCNASQFLSLTLRAPCNALRCYGESFLLENDQLRFCESFQDYSYNLPGFSDDLAKSGRGTSFIDGVGLPGTCKTKRVVEIHNLKLLILDGYFDTGGSRLAEFAEVFKIACTVPVIVPIKDSGTEFIGVVVLYLTCEPIDLEPLQSYLEALVQNMGSAYNLLEKRAIVSAMMEAHEGQRSNSVSAGDDIEAPRKVSKISVVSVVSNGSIHKLEIENNVPDSTKIVKQKRPLTQHLLVEKAVPWVKRYFTKWLGGKNTLPPGLEYKYCVATFVGSFAAIAIIQVIFNHINAVFVYRGVHNSFFIPTSFGALCTIVFALPAAPLGQPRILFMAHTWAMAVSIVIMYIFEQHHYVWLQLALAAGFCTGGMALFGILNPPSGAISLALIVFRNSATFSHAGLLFDVVSTYICCTVITVVGIVMHNVLRDRAYPTVW